MNTEQIRGLVASELIIIAMEQKTKKPSELNFDELIDVTTELVKKLTIQHVSKRSELLMAFGRHLMKWGNTKLSEKMMKKEIIDFESHL